MRMACIRIYQSDSLRFLLIDCALRTVHNSPSSSFCASVPAWTYRRSSVTSFIATKMQYYVVQSPQAYSIIISKLKSLLRHCSDEKCEVEAIRSIFDELFPSNFVKTLRFADGKWTALFDVPATYRCNVSKQMISIFAMRIICTSNALIRH